VRTVGRAWPVWLLVLGLSAAGCGAQTLPQATTDELHALTQQAAAIFTGQVVSVTRQEGQAGSGGVVTIDFAVQDAIRGAGGGVYALKEWGGLSPVLAQPFRVGQRYLMLLHATNAAGLSSPVGGADGAIPIGGGAGLATETDGAAGAELRAAGPMEADGVDLSWIATRVVRTISYRDGPRGTAVPVASRPEVASAAAAGGGADGGGAVLARQRASYGSVVGLLRSWEAGGHGGR
jgi:hypothetical protein